GSFEDWSALIRGAVVWVLMPDPADTREELRLGSCPEADALAALYAGLEALDPKGQGLTVASIIEQAEIHGAKPAVKALREALLVLCPNQSKPGAPIAQSVGMKLHHLCNRVIGGKVLERLPDTKTGARWRVVRSGTSGTSGTKSG